MRVIDVEKLGLPKKGDAVDWLAANPDATAVDVLGLTCVDAPRRDESGEQDPNTGGFAGGPAWPEPKPIQAALHPVPAFDPETLLPEALRGWIVDEADRMPCPPDFVAATALVELGSIIGTRCAIKPKARDDWLIVPNLWGGDVGLSSAKKSPTGDPTAHPYVVKKRARVVSQGDQRRTGRKGEISQGLLEDARKHGCFHPFSKLRGARRVLIGVGVASVAACVTVDLSPAAAATDSGNLAAVGLAVRALAPTAEIVFLADNDIKPSVANPGLKAAMNAARTVGGRPPISHGRWCPRAPWEDPPWEKLIWIEAEGRPWWCQGWR